MGVSRATAHKWLARNRAEGAAGLVDRSSRPHRSPSRTDPVVEAQIVALRRDRCSPGTACRGWRSRAWRDALAEIGARARFTRRYRLQTNGKAERFNRTMLEEWAYAQVFESGDERAAALPQWLHTYNHHRGHTALGGHPPISRVNDLPAHHG